MAADKNDSNKRKYKYPYRPFFWSLNAKPSLSIFAKVESIDKMDLSEKDF
jgi:hypothetical protein